jgi:hypothetical protein
LLCPPLPSPMLYTLIPVLPLFLLCPPSRPLPNLLCSPFYISSALPSSHLSCKFLSLLLSSLLIGCSLQYPPYPLLALKFTYIAESTTVRMDEDLSTSTSYNPTKYARSCSCASLHKPGLGWLT